LLIVLRRSTLKENFPSFILGGGIVQSYENDSIALVDINLKNVKNEIETVHEKLKMTRRQTSLKQSIVAQSRVSIHNTNSLKLSFIYFRT